MRPLSEKTNFVIVGNYNRRFVLANSSRSLLVLYTGGTIGMKENPLTGGLAPFNITQLEREVPEVLKFGYLLETRPLYPLLDSSDADPSFWIRIAKEIYNNYDNFDGFVVLHGTDTMAYTASALSFMLPGLSKPVVLTGSQLPLGAIRTDGKENLLGAIEIAAARDTEGNPRVSEVCIFFDHRLFRGNRTTKFGASRFDAFRSYNYPLLAEAGINIVYNDAVILPWTDAKLNLRTHFDTQVATLYLFPGMQAEYVEAILGMQNLHGVILKTFGAGNAPSARWFLRAVEAAIKRSVLFVNISQCQADEVSMGSYDTGLGLEHMGVLSGGNMTYEAALSKLMLALGAKDSVVEYLESNIAGERN